MKNLKNIAAALALFIGLMSVFAGSKVLLGIDAKDYTVLTWLVSYNVLFGIISVFTAYLIWRDKEKNKALIIFILTSHFVVFLVLKYFISNAASESIKAMVFRTGIWVLIALLSLVIPRYFNKVKN